MHFRRTTLGACCDIVSGATPSTHEPSYWEGEIEWATPRDLSQLNGPHLHRTERRITREGLLSCGATLLPPNSVLFSSRAPIGHVAINAVPMATNQGFKSFVPHPDEVDPSFLYHWLRARRPYLESLGTGATFKEVSKAVVARVEIDLPPMSEQLRLAAIMDAADTVRRKRSATIAIADTLLRSYFLEMFGDPVRNPKNWPVGPLTALGRISTGNTPPRGVDAYFGSDIEWIKSDNINSPSHFLTQATEGLSALGRAVGRVVPSGSTLITCIAGSPECIGNVGLADREVAFNQQINAVTPFEGVDHRFVYSMLLVGKPLVQAASTSGMKGMVSKGKLEAVRVPIPPRPLQAKFGVLFDDVVRLVGDLESAKSAAERLLQSTVHLAFSGGLTRKGLPC